MNMKSTANRQKQLGLSLIELLISMTLSIMLLGAVMQVFLSTQLTYNLTGDTSRIQENGRFSLDYMTQSLRMANYIPQQNTNTPYDPFLQTACGSYDPCTADGGTNTADRVGVVFMPPSGTDCTGAAVPDTDVIANVFNITVTNNLNSLTCRGFNVTTNAWVGTEQPLIDGIDNMQILYGINSATDGSANVTQYVSANDVADWAQVASIRLGILVSAGGEAGKGEHKTRKYVLLDSTEISIEDKNTRQIYSTTIALNNIVFTDS